MEVILSTAVTCTIMGAVLSTMVIASRAIDNGPTKWITVAGDAASDVTTDLSLARGATEREDHAVTVSVPDRDGDGQAETIRYSWSGTAGDPLLREYNGGDAAIVATNVHRFNLSYLTKTVAAGEGTAGGCGEVETETESDEKVLKHHDNAPGGQIKSTKVRHNRWVGTYFEPALSDGATKWKISYVKLLLRRQGNANGVSTVQIRTANAAKKPTTTVLAQATVSESSLSSSFQWVTVNLGPVEDLDPDKGYCIVIKQTGGSNDSCKIEYEQNGNPMTADAHLLWTTNSGGYWNTGGGSRDLRFYVGGTETTTGGS